MVLLSRFIFQKVGSMLKVLIAEDDPRIALLHQNMVEKVAGFEVISIANTISELKEYVALMNPDLILLDVYFPMAMVSIF